MSDTQKMLRAVINGQTALKQEILGKINILDKKVDKLGIRLENKIDKVDVKLTKRIDKLGAQLAYLEDDAPREEHDKLDQRVEKVEHSVASI